MWPVVAIDAGRPGDDGREAGGAIATPPAVDSAQICRPEGTRSLLERVKPKHDASTQTQNVGDEVAPIRVAQHQVRHGGVVPSPALSFKSQPTKRAEPISRSMRCE